MGKDRRKKDALKKQGAPPASNETDSGPKGQREPKVRNQQREITKNADTGTTVKDKSIDNPPAVEDENKPEPVNTEELFANLKRETDDIKALTSKKYAKRQILSNWEKYEEPAPPPQYEVDIQGADFEFLQEAPSSGGHFQFKSERSWDANVSALSGELFSLDVDMLADGLATLPLYKKLDVPITLFSKDEKENMDCLARTAMKQYDATRKNVRKTRDKNKQVKEITNRLLDIIKEPSPAPTENKTLLNFDIDQPEIQNEIEENLNEKESYISDEPRIYEKPVLRQTSPPSFNVNKTHEEHPKATLNKVPAEPLIELQQDVLPPRRNKKALTIRESKKYSELPQDINNEATDDAGMSLRETRKQSTPPKEFKRENFTPVREIEKDSTPAKEIKHENLTPDKEIKKDSTPPKEFKRENFTPVREIKKDSTPPKEMCIGLPKQAQQTCDIDSSENVTEEPAVPLGQRTSKRKGKGQSQASENQNKAQIPRTERKAQISERQDDSVSKTENKVEFVESQKKYQAPEKQSKNQITENKAQDSKSQKKVQISDNQPKVLQAKHRPADDDLDFLLSLKKPVRESQLSGLQSCQVGKPSIEEDDASGLGTLALPQKQTEDLEDWLDSMLDD